MTYRPGKELQTEFLLYAAEHADLRAVWIWVYTHADRSAQRSPSGQWSLEGGLPVSQHLFREVARRAAGRLPNPSSAEPWRIWLDAMRTEGYARKVSPKVVPWRQYKAAAERSENLPLPPEFENQCIENVFKSSADFCQVRSLAECHPMGTRADIQNGDPSRMRTFLDANHPKFMYHPTKPDVQVFSQKEIEELGPEWSETYMHQEYPKCKYHWNGKTVTVKNLEEELALGGGWASAPVFEAYRDPARARPKDPNPLKWIDQWSPTLQSPEHQRRIRVELLQAHAAFSKSPDYPSATTDAMGQAFTGIAAVLFDAGLLTEPILENDLPDLVWDSAVSGGWWHLVSETPRDIFPEKVGHYWVWLDGSRDWPALFRAERAEWLARLYEMPAMEASPRDAKTSEITLSYTELSETTDSDEANAGECGPSPAAGRFPKRAAWLEDQLAIREWNVHDLRSQRGPDWKSARKVLDGIGVKRSVLKKIALALSRKKSNVRFEGIPSE